MTDAEFYSLALGVASAAHQQFGYESERTDLDEQSREFYRRCSQRANALFHAAWDRAYKGMDD